MNTFRVRVCAALVAVVVVAAPTPASAVASDGTADAARVGPERQTVSPARLKTVGNLQCLDNWVTIAGGGTNVNWRVDPATGYVSANGNPAVDRWNQLFLPCWAPNRNWPAHEWAFLANANGRVVSFVRDHENPINTRLSPTSSVADLEAGARFNHCSYDGNWYYLRIDGSPVLHVKQEFGALYAMGGPLNGDKLLRVTSPLNANTRCYTQ